jgi:predicted nucleotidyltransferase
LEAASPTCILVFGSAGRYEMRADSDIDFIVITHDEDDVASLTARVLGRKPPHEVAADILFYTERAFLERARMGGACYLAMNEGRVIYGHLPVEGKKP